MTSQPFTDWPCIGLFGEPTFHLLISEEVDQLEKAEQQRERIAKMKKQKT